MQNVTKTNVFVTNLIIRVNPSVGLKPLAIIINDVDLPAPIVSDGPTSIKILRWEPYCPAMRDKLI
ncbi:hypothetical protein COF61_26350 [Bacillus toyonensis]|nr:hypothetical protein COF61_26350 [Bacillus toyonensis]